METINHMHTSYCHTHDSQFQTTCSATINMKNWIQFPPKIVCPVNDATYHIWVLTCMPPTVNNKMPPRVDSSHYSYIQQPSKVIKTYNYLQKSLGNVGKLFKCLWKYLEVFKILILEILVMWMQKSHAINFFSPVMSHDVVRKCNPSCTPITEKVNLK